MFSQALNLDPCLFVDTSSSICVFVTFTMISSADHHPRFLKTTIPPPSNHSELRVAPPGSRLQLEFIHGCSKRGCRGNILHMNNKGRLVYPAAACGTVLDIENNTQQIFNKHTDDVVCIAKQ